MTNNKILTVTGARPQSIKATPVSPALKASMMTVRDDLDGHAGSQEQKRA